MASLIWITTLFTSALLEKLEKLLTFINSISFYTIIEILRKRDVIVTFDQNVKNAISAEFGILAVSLPDWWFLRTKGVIGTFSQTVKAGIF